VRSKKAFFLVVVISLFFNTYLALGSTANITSFNYQSCTIFTVVIGDTVYFCNNEDYDLDGTYLWFIPSQEYITPTGPKQTYGAVYFGFDNNNHPGDGYVQGGMNDQGLCFDGNGLPLISMNPHPEREETHPYYHVNLEKLWICSNVDDVINYYESHYFGDAIASQSHYADAMGNAVVVSVGTDGEFAYTRRGNSSFLISTNFNLANYSHGWYPCWRYTKAHFELTHLTDDKDTTVRAYRDVLDAVNFQTTTYSNIFDPAHREIYIYNKHDFGNVVKLNLDEELNTVDPGVSGPNTTLGYNIWSYGALSSKAIRISELFDSSPVTDQPIYIHFSPQVMLAIILGVLSFVSLVTVASFFLLGFFRKRRFTEH
jgi:hypothetical protein